MACLEQSKVCEIVSADTIRLVFESASSELWREGEFRLEVVWKILCQQPGLDARAVAPPLFAFKSFEADLGVRVVLPDSLSAIPKIEQERLRSQASITKEELVARLEQHRTTTESAEASPAPAAPSGMEDAVNRAAAEPEGAASFRFIPVQPKPDRRKLALGLSAVAAVCLGVGLFVAFGIGPVGFDVSDVRSIVQLEGAIRQDRSMVARLTDPRWNSLPKEEQRRLATALLDHEVPKGIVSITLKDETDAVRVIATAVGEARQVIVP